MTVIINPYAIIITITTPPPKPSNILLRIKIVTNLNNPYQHTNLFKNPIMKYKK